MAFLLQAAGSRATARPGRQPRPVRGARLAVAGLPDPALRDLARPARPPGLAASSGSCSRTRCSMPGARLLVFTWLKARLAGPRRPGGRRRLGAAAWLTCCGRTGSPGTSSRRRGTGGGTGSTGAAGMAAMTLAGLAPSYRGRVLVPVLVDVRAAGCGGPGDGAAGDRAGSGRLRRPDPEPRPCLRRAAVPGPRRAAGPGDAGVRPRRHPRRPDRRASRRPAW